MYIYCTWGQVDGTLFTINFIKFYLLCDSVYVLLASAAYICANVPCIMMLGWVENLMIIVDTSIDNRVGKMDWKWVDDVQFG